MHKYQITTVPTQRHINGNTETVQAADMDISGGWMSFYDGDGLVLRLPEKTVERVERVNG
ncbi:hypothetical protein [Pseudonocardia hydrocarbonoxydans]|uniref:Uncharacterized protein n=1 Tax=Pseudonocardia hydrocarbonoxydans TaxID=76726 RepID=A0A4Y3WUA5_9PSEU|nr:hypothetical protein [Pseudonocardia hydrocarbonoxydans]GEC21871.1 hypothetical protein PHY01_41540 [Pseudonocardia hydrocarbonoxydans]